MNWMAKNPDSLLGVKGGFAIMLAAVFSLLLLLDVLRGEGLIGSIVLTQITLSFALIAYYMWYETERRFSKSSSTKRKIILVLTCLSGIIIAPIHVLIAPLIGGLLLFMIFSFYKARKTEQENGSVPPWQKDKIIGCHKLAALAVIAVCASQATFVNIVSAHADKKVSSTHNQKTTP